VTQQMPMGKSRQHRQRPGYAFRYATTAGPCRRCGLSIRIGEHISLNALEYSHVTCRRLGVVAAPMADPPSRYRNDPAVGKPCDGCGFPIEQGEAVTYIVTVPWHTECRRRHR